MKQLKTETEYKNQSVEVPLPHHTYVDRVLRSSSYEELMWRFISADSPAKEISESYAAFSNLKKVCRVDGFNWLHIGDGGHTRTAAIFTFFSKTLNFSIDPALNFVKFVNWQVKFDVRNIVCHRAKFEDVPEKDIQIAGKDFPKGKPYNICCVHAHVELEKVNKQYPNWTYLYSNPCCKPGTQMFTEEYMKENHITKIVDKMDLGILSEKRRVLIYKKLK